MHVLDFAGKIFFHNLKLGGVMEWGFGILLMQRAAI
jgi:hypothetical protein